MASQSGVFSEAGGSGQGIISSSEVRSEDLPSKRLLGKGLASIGYETELNGMRFARKDFVGVPIGVFKTEAAKLLGLKDHQNVVKTHYIAADEVCCSLVMDLMDDDFLAVLHKRKWRVGNRSSTDLSFPFARPEALGFMLQIARGMEHLHDQGVVHGDLKTKNILVTHAKDGSLSLKVSDFGLVQTKRRSMSYVSRHARKLGMARWKAPEELSKMEDQEETSSESDEEEGVGASTDDDLRRADVYSFALTCCHLLTGEDPYPNPNWRDLVAKIAVGGLRPTLPAACPRSLRDLLVACWSNVPAQRPPFTLVRRELEVLHQESAVHQSSSTVIESFDVVNEINRRIPPTSIQLRPTSGPARLLDEIPTQWREPLNLYGFPGITLTSKRRCANCPGAGRTSQLHQKRCPLDISNEPNLFTQAAAAQAGEGEVIVDPKTNRNTNAAYNEGLF